MNINLVSNTYLISIISITLTLLFKSNLYQLVSIFNFSYNNPKRSLILALLKMFVEAQNRANEARKARQLQQQNVADEIARLKDNTNKNAITIHNFAKCY